MINTYKGCVQPWQCDNFGHLNVQFYVACFDEASWHLLADCGITPEYFRSEQRAIVAVEQNIRYKRELIHGDLISIFSKLVEVGPKILKIKHEMRLVSTNDIASEVLTTAIHLDTQTRKSVPFSDEVMNQLILKVVE